VWYGLLTFGMLNLNITSELVDEDITRLPYQFVAQLAVHGSDGSGSRLLFVGGERRVGERGEGT